LIVVCRGFKISCMKFFVWYIEYVIFWVAWVWPKQRRFNRTVDKAKRTRYVLLNVLRLHTMWVASPWGFSEMTIQLCRHEWHACCPLQAEKPGIQPVVGNTHGTHVEQVVSSFQKILRGSQLTWYTWSILASSKISCVTAIFSQPQRGSWKDGFPRQEHVVRHLKGHNLIAGAMY